jgi:hypothetical protein
LMCWHGSPPVIETLRSSSWLNGPMMAGTTADLDVKRLDPAELETTFQHERFVERWFHSLSSKPCHPVGVTRPAFFLFFFLRGSLFANRRPSYERPNRAFPAAVVV